MRILFVTPLLWKRIDRAVRRREEGQAMILVALAAIAMVAIVGLSVDGGLAYLETQKLQRTADAAALAGVIWIPNQPTIADGRAKLSTQANGYNPYVTTDPAASNYITGNWTYDDVKAAPAGTKVLFQSFIPKATQYKVTLGEMAHRYFLGVIGLGDYYIQRNATAEYSIPVKLGSSFNYLGSSGVLYDPSVNPGSANDLYGRYVSNRCNQANAPIPCVGTFWLNIEGADAVHANGDAYSPLHDGQNGAYATGHWSGNRIGTNTYDTGTQYKTCSYSLQHPSWFINDQTGNPNGGLVNYSSTNPNRSVGGQGPCSNETASQNPPNLNLDLHPDSGQRRNFGYEIGIEVDVNALKPGSIPNASQPGNHTNLNVSIYDAAFATPDSTQLWNAGDIYNAAYNSGQVDGTFKPNPPLFTPWNANPFESPYYEQRDISQRPYTGTVKPATPYLGTGECAPTASYNSQPEYNDNSWRRCLSPYWVTDTNTILNFDYNVASPNDISRSGTGLTFGAGQPYRNNEMRARYSLYWPPPAPGLTSAYENVAFSGNLIGAFEVGNMSMRISSGINTNAVPSGYSASTKMPIEQDLALDGTGSSYAANLYNSYCYLVSLNPPSPLVGQSSDGVPASNPQTGAVPSSIQTYNLTDIQVWNDTQFVYACPQSGGSRNGTGPGSTYSPAYTTDYYWGMPFPSSSITYNVNVANDAGKTNPATYYKKTATNPVLSPSTALSNTKIVTDWVTTGSNALYPYGIRPGNFDYIDPGQECRVSVGSAPGVGSASPYNVTPNAGYASPIEPLYEWGSPRMPFNAAFGDRINTVNYDSVTGKYWTQYWSRHGWRCNWDFDSDYDPRFNPLNPATPAGTKAEPLDTSASNSNITNNGNSIFGNGKQEPFFHLTDYTWNAAGNRVLKQVLSNPSDPNSAKVTITPGSSNAVVRPGVYMLHVQNYGGGGANRYAVKAEYENANPITYTLGYNVDANGKKTPITTTVTPVPSVFGITTFSIYANAANTNGTGNSDIVFDLAYISPENAGATAILQLWDPGDVAGNLRLALLEPSPSGNRLTSGGKIALGNPITTTVSSCPYYQSNVSNCKTDPSPETLVDMTINGTNYFNDQWVNLLFQIPGKPAFDNYLNQCIQNKVPEEACYYFQIDYKLTGGSATDNTTWQIIVPNTPVHLLK